MTASDALDWLREVVRQCGVAAYTEPLRKAKVTAAIKALEERIKELETVGVIPFAD